MPYSSYITNVQGIYNALNAALFPGGVLAPGPFLDEAPTMASSTQRISPPYVLLFDEGGSPQWTFTGEGGKNTPGQNAISAGSFRLEVYDVDLGVADSIMDAILWNGQVPNNRHGLAFATFVLTSPEKGIAGYPIPMRNQRNYAGFKFNNDRVHVVKQWFTIKTAISGDGQ